MSLIRNSTLDQASTTNFIRYSAPSKKPVTLSVVVTSWNSSEFIEECLGAVYESAGSDAVEVIVVDNASTDGSPALIRQKFPDVQLIVNDRNMGCSVAFNQGISASTGTYVQILCPDTIVQPGALQQMTAFLDAHPDVGAVGPRLNYPDGRMQPSCRTFPTFSTFLWEFIGLSRLFPRHPVFGRWRMGNFDHETLREVDQPRGSSLMVRRDMVSQIGLWDEHLEMFFNDVDWCLRMRQNSWKIFFLPTALMIHYGGSSVKKVRPQMILLSHRCCYLYFKKHQKGIFQGMAVKMLGLALFASAGIRYGIARLRGE